MLQWEPYREAKNIWPGSGRHILAQYDEDSILVYQAYKRSIGTYAAKHKTFVGCPEFSDTRMTWVKTNFLWMQYRSGWATKHNQEVILAIWLTRDGFEKILELSREAASYEERQAGVKKGKKPIPHPELDGDDDSEEGGSKGKKEKRPRSQGAVRLQWDPDHSPSGARETRRAVQLGLRGVQGFVNGDWIIDIQDITEMVHEQSKKSPEELLVPRERVFTPLNEENARRIRIDPAPK